MSVLDFLDQLLNPVPLAKPTPIAVEERNVLRHPFAAPPSVRHGTLVHISAGLAEDATPPDRVSVFLGPGATFAGIAVTLLPHYQAAAAAGGPAAPTVDQIARDLVVYNQDRLPTADWSNHKVGLRLTLPIEIAANGDWIVDAGGVQLRALLFVSTWRPRLRTPPAPLDVPDPFVLEAGALILSLAPLPSLAPQLWASALRNPFDGVLQVLAVLRALGTPAPGTAGRAALAMLDGATDQQAALLAGTSAGNAILRRLAALLKVAPAGADPAKLARARKLLDDALFQGPAGARTLVAHRELPQTPRQLQAQAGEAEPVAGAASDPAGGLHRLVLGRDLAVGRSQPRPRAGGSSTGPAFAGRVRNAPILRTDVTHHNPAGDQRVAALLTILEGGREHARFDAVDTRGPAPLAAGLGRWSALVADELPTLLLAVKRQAADEFDLFFALHRLDVDEPDPVAHPGRGRLLRIGDGGLSTPVDEATVRTFLGATGAGGNVTIAPEWAARLRLPALASRAYRRLQVAQAVARLQRVAPRPKVDAVSVTPVPKIDVSIDGLVNLPAPAVGRTFKVSRKFRDLATVRGVLRPNSTDDWGMYGKAYLDHGKLLVDPDDATKFVVPTAMRIVFPEDPARPGVVAGSGKLPVVVIIHGNHAALDPIYAPPVGMTQVTLPNGAQANVPFSDTASSVTEVANHDGYARLQDLLATLGIISVSVNTNAANAFDSGIDMRANTVVAALKDLLRRNRDAASPYRGRLDLKKLGLMGHSRGGDVAVALAKRLKGHTDFKVKTVCSLAPTDFSGMATDATQLRLTRDDIAFYLVVYGSLDGDVTGLDGADSFGGTGFRHYDRAQCPKAMVQLSRCCHNRFNSVWSDGSPLLPADPLLKFRRDDRRIVAADLPRLCSFDEHQRLEVEYVGGLFRWQLLGHDGVTDLLDGTRANTVGVPASLQWSFGSRVVALDDLEDPTEPSLPNATRTLDRGVRVPFTDIAVPESTLKTLGAAAPVMIGEHVTHRSQVLHVDAVAPPPTAEAMHVDIPAAGANWRPFTLLTFRISYTLDISTEPKHSSSPAPRAALVLADTAGRTKRLADALAFSVGVPAAPEFHLVDVPGPNKNATLFRFETVRVPLEAFAGAGGVDLAKVKRLAVEFDRTNGTHVMFDSFQLVKA